MDKKVKFKEYMCTWCGKKERRSSIAGRPAPGVCPKRSTSDRKRPHVWVVNKTIEM